MTLMYKQQTLIVSLHFTKIIKLFFKYDWLITMLFQGQQICWPRNMSHSVKSGSAAVHGSLVCGPCFALERGVRIAVFGSRCSDPGVPALMSWVSVSCRGLDTRAPRSVSCGHEFARPRARPATCVLCCCTQFVFLSAACIHVMYWAVWHASCVFQLARSYTRQRTYTTHKPTTVDISSQVHHCPFIQ